MGGTPGNGGPAIPRNPEYPQRRVKPDMKTSGRVLTILAVLLALISAVGCSKLRARDQLNKGVQAYKNTKYEAAIGYFQKAVDLDPSLINARLYLATAYAQQYI